MFNSLPTNCICTQQLEILVLALIAPWSFVITWVTNLSLYNVDEVFQSLLSVVTAKRH